MARSYSVANSYMHIVMDDQLSMTCSNNTEVAQWAAPSWSWPQPATNNGVRDSRSNWMWAINHKTCISLWDVKVRPSECQPTAMPVLPLSPLQCLCGHSTHHNAWAATQPTTMPVLPLSPQQSLWCHSAHRNACAATQPTAMPVLPLSPKQCMSVLPLSPLQCLCCHAAHCNACTATEPTAMPVLSLSPPQCLCCHSAHPKQ